MAIRTQSGTEVEILGREPDSDLIKIKMPFVNEVLLVAVEDLQADNGPDEIILAVAETMERNKQAEG